MRHPPELLVVDDDAEVRSYLELALSSLGVVIRTDDGTGGVPDPLPDAALVDLLLGERDGVPLVEALCAAGVPVAAMSGLAPEAAPMEAARRAGARILAKPFGLQPLRDMARALLSARTAPPASSE